MEILIIVAIAVIFVIKANALSKKNKQLEYQIAQYESEQSSSKEDSAIEYDELNDSIFPIRDMEKQKFNRKLRSGFFNGYILIKKCEGLELIEIHNDSGLLLGFLWLGEYYHQLLHQKYNGILNIYGYAKYDSYDKC